jgi:hypothetical protein
MIPLLVSAAISHLTSKSVREKEFRLIFREMGKARGIEGEFLDLFVENMLQAKEGAFKEAEKKAMARSTNL